MRRPFGDGEVARWVDEGSLEVINDDDGGELWIDGGLLGRYFFSRNCGKGS